VTAPRASGHSRAHARRRALIAQGAALVGAAVIFWGVGQNVAAALDERGIALGFGFLRQPANFEIGEAWLRYRPEDSIGRAILVGLANTVVVSALGCLLSLVVGFALGFMGLSSNPPLRGVVRGYVELVRNVPLLLLLLVLVASLHALPPPAAALRPLPGVSVSNHGLDFGGRTLSPEFAALLGALVLHHAANVSEVVRGAVQSVAAGQRDAARALGLSRAQAMRFVILPLALRAMVPLLASNAVSLVKNSSLAVAIGFPDVVSILNTTGNQTGHAIEAMLIMIAVYLSVSLAIGAALDRYNRRLLASELAVR
jgi:general L-amino acid transport system permease protein